MVRFIPIGPTRINIELVESMSVHANASAAGRWVFRFDMVSGACFYFDSEIDGLPEAIYNLGYQRSPAEALLELGRFPTAPLPAGVFVYMPPVA